MAETEREMLEQTETVTDDNPLGTEQAPSEEPPRDRVAERIQELSQEVSGLRSVTAAQQAELQRARSQAGTPAFTPKPEYETHEFKRYLDAQYGAILAQQHQAIANLANQNDLLSTRSAIDDLYGAGTYRKHAKRIEDEFQAELAKGTPESREKIFYRVAAQMQTKLVPVDEREESTVRQERKRSAKLALVSNNAPARAASHPGPEKPISAMTKDERDAAFQSYIQKTGGF